MRQIEHVHPDALELATLLRPTWPDILTGLRASGTPLNEGGDGGGGSGDGGGGSGDGGGSGNGASTTFTQDQVNDLVAREKGKIQQKYGDYDALKAKAGELDTLKAASQSDAERLTGEVNTLKGENGSLKAESMRLKVALKKGLVGDKAVLADRLSGDTPEAMEKDADELLKLFGGGSTGFDGGARGGGGNQPRDMDAFIRQLAGRSST